MMIACCRVIGLTEDSVPQQKTASREAEILQLWNSGEKSDALKRLEEWKRSDKKSPEPWVTAAQIAFSEKKYKRCLSYAKKALDRSAESAEGYYWRGRAFEAMENWLDAGNEYRAALLANPSFSPAKESLDRVDPQLGVSVRGNSQQ
jgi:tetratricopeptide (TPR) repeat protein